MDYYMPSILLVITSWVAFWLDTDAVSGRIIIGQYKQIVCSAVHTAYMVRIHFRYNNYISQTHPIY